MNPLERAFLTSAVRLERELRPELTTREKLRAYAQDPGRFALDILQTKLWRKQRELAESLLEHRRVACCSGQKTGKTTTLATIALWLYCQGWRVFATTPTEHQMNQAFWREVRRLGALATIPLPGWADIHMSARGGLHDHETQAHIVGLLGRDVEALQGMSGRLAFIIDEASGVDKLLIEAIKGNLVGGGLLVMAGNPTRNEGEFYEAFTSKRDIYRLFEISSLDVPRGSEAIPGLALPEDCEAFRKEYGEDSPFYQVRVLGRFVVGQEGCVLPIGLIEQCHAAWRDNDVPDDGVLIVSCDPAGPGGDGDESAFAVKRGQRILELLCRRGLDTNDHLVQVDALIDKWGRAGDRLVFIVDREGDYGRDIYYEARRHFGERVHVIGFLGGKPAVRQPDIYMMRRDEAITFVAKQARANELAIPPDVKLDQELNSYKLEQQLNGKFRVTPKKQIRSLLGRSPDRADAVMMANWWVPSLRDEHAGRNEDGRPPERTWDPFPDDGGLGQVYPDEIFRPRDE